MNLLQIILAAFSVIKARNEQADAAEKQAPESTTSEDKKKPLSKVRGIDIMKNYLGCQEVRDKQKLEQFFRANSINGDLDIDPATTSWCSAMINACERAVGNKGTGSLMARSWLKWGVAVPFDDAQEGDIVIFDFEHDGIHGHVTYFGSWDDANNTLGCLGGNQSNMVKWSTYIQDSIVDIRRAK